MRSPPHHASFSRCTHSEPAARPSFAQMAHEMRFLETPNYVDAMLNRKRESALINSVFPPKASRA